MATTTSTNIAGAPRPPPKSGGASDSSNGAGVNVRDGVRAGVIRVGVAVGREGVTEGTVDVAEACESWPADGITVVSTFGAGVAPASGPAAISDSGGPTVPDSRQLGQVIICAGSKSCNALAMTSMQLVAVETGERRTPSGTRAWGSVGGVMRQAP